jgi:hypothetical protein
MGETARGKAGNAAFGGRDAITQTGTISLGVDGELASELTHTLRLALAPGPS